MTRRPGAQAALVFSSIAHTYAHLFMLLYPTAVIGIERALGLPFGELITLSLPGFILFGAGAMPAGWLGDRWSPIGMIGVFFFGTGIAAILTGLASTKLEIALGLGLIGLFASIYHPVGIPWLVRNATQKGRALGINGIFGMLGIAAGAVVAGALTEFIGWRAAFVVPGAIAVATGIAFVLVVRGGGVAGPAADTKPEVEPSRRDMIRVFSVLVVTIFTIGLVFHASSVSLPKLFSLRVGNVIGDGAFGVGGLVTLVYLTAVPGQYFGGWLADKYPLRRVYFFAFFFLTPAMFMVGIAAGVPLLIAAVVMTNINVIAAPAENMLLLRYSPSRWRSTIFGAKFVLSLGASSLGVPMVAYVYGVTGDFYWIYASLAGACAVATAAILFLPGGKTADSDAAVSVASPAE